MKVCAAIGEALIDFIPVQTGCELKEVTGFTRACGGAPANVAAVVAKLGGKSRIITQLGSDAFGDFIEQTLAETGVDTQAITRTREANTTLAFVSLKENGDRDFAFYRKPGAEMLLSPNQIKETWLNDVGILHFCSVALVESPMKETHRQVIEKLAQQGAVISFDPNIRLPLWKDADKCKEAVREFAVYADILKISDEELEFVTGHEQKEEGITSLFNGYPQLKQVLFSKGKHGSELWTRNGMIQSKQEKVKAVDTTGAGDAVIGAFLYELQRLQVKPEQLLTKSKEQWQESLDFANAYAVLSVTRNGAISSYASHVEIERFLTS